MRFNRIFLFLFLFLFTFSSCQAQAVPQESITAEGTEDVLSTVTFLGDSTTAHMQQRSRIDKSRIWASASRALNLDPRITYAKIVAPDTGEEQTIAEVAARLRPPRLVITLGIDYGVYYFRERPDRFAFYYEKLLDAIKGASPETELILQSIFPVARGAKSITNEMIDTANAEIKAIAERRGLLYVDQRPTLADEQGYLRPEFCISDDGIHLTAKAYEAILGHLKSTLSKGGAV